MLHYKGVAKTRFRKGCDVALCVFGVITMVYTTTLTIRSWVSGGGPPASPGYCDSRVTTESSGAGRFLLG
jgi:solute carrier family 36 (proton-coupled amino acid transporter)